MNGGRGHGLGCVRGISVGCGRGNGGGRGRGRGRGGENKKIITDVEISDQNRFFTNE